MAIAAGASNKTVWLRYWAEVMATGGTFIQSLLHRSWWISSRCKLMDRYTKQASNVWICCGSIMLRRRPPQLLWQVLVFHVFLLCSVGG